MNGGLASAVAAGYGRVSEDLEAKMKIAGNIVAVVVLLIGGLWTLQGANVVAGSMMSGQSQWLYIGILLIIVALVALWWLNLRRR